MQRYPHPALLLYVVRLTLLPNSGKFSNLFILQPVGSSSRAERPSVTINVRGRPAADSSEVSEVVEKPREALIRNNTVLAEHCGVSLITANASYSYILDCEVIEFGCYACSHALQPSQLAFHASQS